MARKKQSNSTRKKKLNRKRRRKVEKRKQQKQKNKKVFREVLEWFAVKGQLFTKNQFHGNTKWTAEHLVAEALIWSWQDAKNVTDAFTQSLEVCQELSMNVAMTYTSFINALDTHADVFGDRLRERYGERQMRTYPSRSRQSSVFPAKVWRLRLREVNSFLPLAYQELAEEIAGRFWRCYGWVFMGFDGSRATMPRTVSNEKAFCAPNYGKSTIMLPPKMLHSVGRLGFTRRVSIRSRQNADHDFKQRYGRVRDGRCGLVAADDEAVARRQYRRSDGLGQIRQHTIATEIRTAERLDMVSHAVGKRH